MSFKREKYLFRGRKNTVSTIKLIFFLIVLILETKSVENLNDKHIAQCINYLKVSECRLAILVNFHKNLLDHKRIVFKKPLFLWQKERIQQKLIRAFVAKNNI